MLYNNFCNIVDEMWEVISQLMENLLILTRLENIIAGQPEYPMGEEPGGAYVCVDSIC